MMSPLISIYEAYAYVKQDEKARQDFYTLMQFATIFVNTSIGNFPIANTGYKKPTVSGPVKNNSSVHTATLMDILEILVRSWLTILLIGIRRKRKNLTILQIHS